MKKFAVSEDLLNAIMQYLAQRPFAEVTGLIGELQRSAKLIEDKVAKSEEPKKPVKKK